MANTSVTEPRIKNWGTQQERIVLLSLAGKNNKQIAEVLGKSRGWIGDILNDPRAVKIKSEFLVELRERLMGEFSDQILDLAGYALKNLGRTLKVHVDPDELGKKQHQDRMSVEVLKMAGVGYEDRALRGPILALTKEESEALTAAWQKSDEAREIHGGSYEVIDDEPNGKGEVAD